MIDPAPVLDLYIGPDHGGARLYVSRRSWCPPILRQLLNAALEARLAALPDWSKLDRHMWETDSPYESRLTKGGGAEIRARGRSAVNLLVWLDGILDDSR